MPIADLGAFEGRTVTKATIAVRNAGDGLSAAMKVNPENLHQGDTVYVVLECKVGPVSFDPIKDSETECERKHVLRAGAATLIDGALVRSAIEEQTARIIAARDAEAGRLAITPDAAELMEKLTAEHGEGKHKRRKKDCPVCHPFTADVEKANGRPSGAAAARAGAKKTTGKSDKKPPAKKTAAAKSAGNGAGLHSV